MSHAPRSLPPAAPPGRQQWGWDEVLWVAAMMSFPFYFGPKGGIQISSVILAMLFAALISRTAREGISLPRGGRLLLGIFAVFFLWSLLVNFSWVIVLSDPEPLIFPAYYIFNGFVLFAVLAMYANHGTRFVEITRWALLASIALQFILSFMFANRGFREMLFFNSANQLGYYALICCSIFSLPVNSSKKLVSQIPWVAGMLMCLWLATLSLSKAATLSCAIFLLLSSIRRPIQLLIAASVAIGLVATAWDQVGHRVENLLVRYESLGDRGEEGSDDNAEGRGYDRIWLYPEMVVLGAGEGGNYRWSETAVAQMRGGTTKMELHSSIGTIMFSYGIPGMLLAGAFFLSVLRPAFFFILPFALPELAYSFTHMSLRFVMTWVYFAMLYVIGLEYAKGRLLASGASSAVGRYLASPGSTLASAAGRVRL